MGSIGDEKRGDLMAGFTKPPFYGAAYENRGAMKGVVLIFERLHNLVSSTSPGSCKMWWRASRRIC